VRGQRAQEKAAIEQGHNLLICDTDLLETLVYSNAYFNKVPKPILDLAQNDHVDLYLLMNIDIPWERDDLRDRPEQRVVLFDLFRNELVTRNKKYVLVSGDATQRLTTAITAIDTLLK
jgi:nicotinamide riboside kinase